MNDFIAGMIAGTAGLVVGYPLDTLKSLMQTTNQTSIKMITKNRKISSYFRGLAMPFISYGPLSSLLFGLYGNTLKLLEPKNDKNKEYSYFNIWLAGTFSGSVLAFPTNPFEVIKIRLQTHDRNEIKGLNECVKNMIRQEGYKGFSRGFGALFLRDSLSYGLYFGMFEFSRRNLKNYGANEYIADFLAGGISGSILWMFILPFDIVKTRQQSSLTEYKNIIETMRELTKEQGVRAHFTLGLFPVIFRGFIVNATILFFYELTNKALEK